MSLDHDTRVRIRDLCEETADTLSRLAPEAHGMRVELWCSSNDPGWKAKIYDDS
ncbi:hypothetical protein H7J07_05480 [Mycobacterium koreense]|uniref:hypothetical protein n=1 Tax=Mycolicibacillus koreensis TaxID=1069220 RepID=UPI00138D839D|nr:hypothetical protein [Mycolicibacillus koreensis]MCV7247675.1 hypothetical protein [Mycolicibacillus koreensis]BBY54060.1 hypothetical protein MKOR_13110 [Mycolicibacillus koreensis]